MALRMFAWVAAATEGHFCERNGRRAKVGAEVDAERSNHANKSGCRHARLFDFILEIEFRYTLSILFAVTG